jgi:hypothetical protein
LCESVLTVLVMYPPHYPKNSLDFSRPHGSLPVSRDVRRDLPAVPGDMALGRSERREMTRAALLPKQASGPGRSSRSLAWSSSAAGRRRWHYPAGQRARIGLQKFVKRNPRRRWRRLPFLRVLLNDSGDSHLKGIYDVTYRKTDCGCRRRECPLFRLFQDIRCHAKLERFL